MSCSKLRPCLHLPGKPDPDPRLFSDSDGIDRSAFQLDVRDWRALEAICHAMVVGGADMAHDDIVQAVDNVRISASGASHHNWDEGFVVAQRYLGRPDGKVRQNVGGGHVCIHRFLNHIPGVFPPNKTKKGPLYSGLLELAMFEERAKVRVEGRGMGDES